MTSPLFPDIRLVILRSLAELPGYKANESVIQSALDMWGHVISRDVVKAQIDWLAEQGLVSVETVTDDIRIATLTARGQDVAEGRARVSGVKRPRAKG